MTTARVGIDITGRDLSGPAFQQAIGNINKLGKTVGDSTNRMRSLSFQVNDIFTSLAGGMNPLMVAVQQGPQIAQIYGMGNGGVAAAFRDVGNMALMAAKKVGPLALIGGAIAAGLTYEVNKATGEAYTMGETFAAAFDVIQDGIYGNVKPAFESLAPWATMAADSATGSFKAMANKVIGYNMAWWEVLKRIGAIAPDVFALVGKSMANAFLGAVELMVNGTVTAVNGMVAGINRVFEMLPESMQPGKLGMMQGIELPKFDTNSSIKAIRSDFDGLFKDVAGSFTRDYLGEFIGSVGDKAAENRAKLQKKDAPKSVRGMKGRVGGSGAKGGVVNSLYDGETDFLGFSGAAEEVTVLTEAVDGLSKMFDSWIDKAVDGSLKFKDVLSGVNDFAKSMLSQTLKSLASNLLQGAEHPLYGGKSGGILGSLVGSLFGGLPSFAVGTPYVQKDMVAQVHKGEAIIPAAVMESARRGGGAGSPVTIIDQRSNAPQIEQKADAMGNMQLIIRDAVKRELPGQLRKQVPAQFGLQHKKKAR